MSQQPDHNPACCHVPPVAGEGYKEKGQWAEIAGLKTYVTGPKDTGRTIIAVYDIFGYWPQTKQGADITAEKTNSLVLMPDFFRGDFVDPRRYPIKNEEDGKIIQAFVAGIADPNERLKDLKAIITEVRKGGARKVGALGYCWGARVAVLAGSATGLDSVAVIHPSWISSEDAPGLNVPIGLFISKDEDQTEFDKFRGILETKPFASSNRYKRYPTMVHGWAAAHANLKDEENKRAYDDVYEETAKFFNATLAE